MKLARACFEGNGSPNYLKIKIKLLCHGMERLLIYSFYLRLQIVVQLNFLFSCHKAGLVEGKTSLANVSLSF